MDFEALDAADALAPLRQRYRVPEGVIYLDGNSLGVPAHAALEAVREAAEGEWADQLIGAWNGADWIGLPRRLGDRIGRLIGAAPGQTVVADSISVNLFKLLAVALALRPGRRTVLSTTENFPTDLYVAEGLGGLLGGERCRLRTVPLASVSAESLAGSVDDDVAVVMLTQVDFRTGARLELEAITRAVHSRGALVLWDLAHSAGAFPVELDLAGADMAVGCGYKFLGGGPGAPAFAYLAERHHPAAQQPITGWMGHARPFDFDPGYAPAPGIDRLLAGTPPILACRALEGALDVFDEVDLAAVRAKSVALGEALIRLVGESEVAGELELASPVDPEQRGSQVAFRHAEAWPLTQALIAEGVVGDFRAPDLLRLGITPLYLRFTDIFDAVVRLEEVLVSGRHRDRRFSRRARVT
ncbi:MAG: kynureninase [Pseudomonadales bacterium]|nr:kynureninase [Pseudomonadales bacterium]